MPSHARTLTASLAAMFMSVLAACSDSTGSNAPAPPSNPLATAISPTLVRLTFSPVSGASSYEIERVTGAQGGTFAPIGSTNTTTYDDATVLPGNTYRYRIRSVRNSAPGDYTNEIQISTGAAGNVDVTQDIAINTTWTADNVYTLKGFIHVVAPATLTIDPGTRIVGDFNTLGASLFVLKGARINAVGTADRPIVFTSSRAPGSRQPGDWGGLIIVGRAPINRTGTIEVEGTGTAAGGGSGQNYPVAYSGDASSNDDSGELKYVRVEFAGYAPSVNTELNSFTFAAVGSGTRLSFLQTMAGLDDSFEFFGGSVDAKFLLSYESGDDHFDMSEGYTGRLQHLIAFQSTVLTQRTGAGQPASDPQGIENDGCNGSGCTTGFNAQPFNVPLVANFTLVGTGATASSGSAGGIGMMLRRGTGGYYVNGIVARYPRFGVSVRDAETFARAQNQSVPDVASANTLLALRNILFAQVPAVFEPAGGAVQGAVFDLGGNALENNGTATTQSLFTSFPTTVDATTTASAFDWTPATGAAQGSGGLATLTGQIATKGGTIVTGTSYRGAAPPAGSANARWWEGWSVYRQN
jgi:hypothetical protein